MRLSGKSRFMGEGDLLISDRAALRPDEGFGAPYSCKQTQQMY
jgi:hypothetical protein